MNRYLAVLCVLAVALGGCSSNHKVTNPAPASVGSLRSYNGTASVGDFLTITLDATAHTLTYSNHSNGDSGVVPYAVNGDGTYTLADTTGNLVSAYEVPGFVLLVQVAKAGPAHDTPALVTAVQSTPATVSGMANRHCNYMQFRTSDGGFEAGAISTDNTGAMSQTAFWPYGTMSASDSFHSSAGGVLTLAQDPSGRFLKGVAGPGDTVYVFFTQNGVFAMDTRSGAVLGFNQAAGKTFDPANAGTYKAIFYEKSGATMNGGIESGTGVVAHGTVTVGADGSITLADAGGTLATGTLTPVADAAWLNGPGRLTEACNGLFTLRLLGAGTRQDAFVTFLNGAVLFSSFRTAVPVTGGNTYDYWYGVALR